MQTEGEHEVCLQVGAGIALSSVGLAGKPRRPCKFIEKEKYEYKKKRNKNKEVSEKNQGPLSELSL